MPVLVPGFSSFNVGMKSEGMLAPMACMRKRREVSM
jgi:hypothetical protein